MKYIWPIPIGVILLLFISLFWGYLGRNAVFYALIVLTLMPITEALIQRKGGKVFAFIGLVAGAVCGLVIGYLIGPYISEVMYGQIPVEYNIRVDLVMWCIFGASFFASLFAAVGGWLGRARSII